ncbi:MAG: pyrroline-5-carboxylate reductase [Solirubrobacteraceae bacterium]|jgi:pyrroline-5-carboxylate reductase|nr:pyrroline-5-carboxylate reductase [Solirubrobacteraceae bacterium]
MIGLIGAGNMARALARGWGEPVLATDGGSGRAAALVAELGGETPGSNAELAERADLVVLACKPYQLDEVALEASAARRVMSVLGGTDAARLRRAFPDAEVYVTMPNTPVEVRRGIVIVAQETPLPDDVRALLDRLGSVVVLPERLMGTATATTGVAPAYVALVAEAMVDAAVKHGLKADLAAELVIGVLAGSAELLRARGGDTLAMRREVTSPGGSTARGLAALEHAGLRTAFLDAMEAVKR